MAQTLQIVMSDEKYMKLQDALSIKGFMYPYGINGQDCQEQLAWILDSYATKVIDEKIKTGRS